MHWIAIMAGGGGTRLWPLSRRRQPKQFLPLLPGGETLLGATARRCRALAPIERTLVVTAASQVDEVLRCVPELRRENLVVEPEGRNTAPCIGLLTVEVLRRDPQATVAVLPSDQHVLDEAGFHAALRQAFVIAERGAIVTIGIRPSAPETGFGYIEAGEALPQSGACRVARFVEKPDRATAEGYLASGRYLWNAGMFIYAAPAMRSAIARHLPALGALLDAIAADPSRTPSLYPGAQKISIDYGVMEKLPAEGALAMVAGDFGWNDVGSWAALGDVHPADAQGNVVLGGSVMVDAHDNIVVSGLGEGDARLVAAVGVRGLVVVATDDAVLVLPRERAQDVRRVVDELERRRRDAYL